MPFFYLLKKPPSVHIGGKTKKMANDIFSLVGPIICIALFLLIGGEIGKSESASIGTLLSYNVSMYFGGGKTSTMCSSCDKTNDNFYYQKRSLSDNNNENNDDNEEDFEQYILEEKRRQSKSPTPATTQMKPRTTSPQTTTTRLIEDDFACSVDGVGRWENGTKRFMDPLDVSRGKFVLTQITVFLYGQFNCRSTWDSPDTHFVLFLGDTPIMERSQDTKPCVCFCKEVITYSTPELTDGFPSYSYKDWNTVRFLVTNNMICINKIQLQLTFAQSEPITSPALSVKDWIVAASVVTITILGIACIIWGLRNYQRPNHRYELVPDMESSPDSQSGNNGTPGTDGRGQYKHVFQIKGTEISLGPRIGKGSYGEVYRARWRGIDVAVKKLPYYLIENKEFMRDFNQEASIMSALRHPNVLQFLGSTMIDNDICILTEYMSRSSLYRLLHDETFDLSYPMIKRFATDTSRGMLYLHKSNPVILHRDLKSHNLLVDDAYKVKISDFGLSKVMKKKK